MADINWDAIGGAAGIIAVLVLSAYGTIRGHRKSDGEPPENRAPTQHEVKLALADMRTLIERRGDDTDDNIADLARQLDRIERMVEKLGDRMDTDSRIGHALARFARPPD